MDLPAECKYYGQRVNVQESIRHKGAKAFFIYRTYMTRRSHVYVQSASCSFYAAAQSLLCSYL